MSGAIAATAIGAGIAAGGSLAGSAISSNAAGKAASTQAQAAEDNAQLQYQATQSALDFQKQQWNTSQQEMVPWLNTGAGALSNLSYLMGIGGAQPSPAPSLQSASPQLSINSPNFSTPAAPSGIPAVPTGFQSGGQRGAGGVAPVNAMSGPVSGVAAAPGYAVPSAPGSGPSGVSLPTGLSLNQPPNTSLGGFGSLMTPYGQTFSAPTDITEQNDPGYQARLKLGTDTLQHSAAARGSLLTGGTAKALDTYAQDYASNEYGNVYNRAFNTFTSNLNQYNQNQSNQFNRLAALAGVGQQAASTLGYLGEGTANSVANTGMTGAAQQAQQLNNAAAATASGYAAQGNIWGNAFSGIGNNISNIYAMRNSGNPYQTLYNAQQYPTADQMPQLQYS